MLRVMNTIGFQDTELVNDIFKGMPIAGFIDPVPTLTERPLTATVTMEQWKEGLPERNKVNIARVVKSQGTPAANA